jgi:hypothetical protein
MKKFFFLIMLLAFVTKAFTQDYLRKSRNQKTTAWVLLGAGTTMVAIGAIGSMTAYTNDIVYIGSLGTEGEPSQGDAYGYLLVAGVVCDAASIPFFISASKNRRLAGTVQMSNQKIYLPQNSSIALRYVPAVSLKIAF